MRTLKFASMLACCALAVNAFAQDEGRSGRRGNEQQGTSGSGQSGTTGSGVTGAGGVTAQTQTETTTQGRRGGAFGQGQGRMQGGMAGAMQVQDRDFAVLLSIGNQGEIEMANFVKDRLQNDQAKQFANQMIQDHTQMLQQLQAAAAGGQGHGQPPVGNVGTSGGITPRTAAPAGTGQAGVDVAAGHATAQAGAANRSFYMPGMNPMLQVKQEIAQECLNQARKDLEQKQGVEVDKAYIATQIVKHQDMIAQLTVAQRRAQDSQFKELVGTGMQKAQHHLDMAKNIMKQLDQQRSGQ